MCLWHQLRKGTRTVLKEEKCLNLLAGIFTLGLEKISYLVPLTRLTKLNGSFVASIGKNVSLNRWAQGNGFRKTTGVLRKFGADLVVIIPLGEFISSVPASCRFP